MAPGSPRASSVYPTGLARTLVEHKLLDSALATRLHDEATQRGTTFVAHTVASGTLNARQIAQTAAGALALQFVDLRAVNIHNAPVEAISDSLIRKHQILPIARDGDHLTIATADPTDQQPLHACQFQSGLHIIAVVVEQDVLTQIIDERFSELNRAVAHLNNIQPGHTLGTSPDNNLPSDSQPANKDAPIVDFVDKILRDAVQRGASDIHFEPYEQQYRIRQRQDGVLYEIARPPAHYSARIASRLKVMSRLDLAERRMPQDGRMQFDMSDGRSIDFRVSTCPTLHGEKVVLRILDPASARMGIENLGFEDDQRALFEQTIQQPYGMVLVTGPTGSGKTVSLYTALSILNNDQRNISTAEDPAEINLAGINQVNVHPRIGLDFATCLRAFLRQDPDVIMVGEIRDLETAEIAIKAAQTGHMVLSTVHTNNAPQTLTRLVNMGVPAYNIAASVSLIIAQRLARRLCKHCKQPADIPSDQLLSAGFCADEIDNLTIYQANDTGCRYCTHGFKGRTGLYQVMPISDNISHTILQGGNSHDIDVQAHREGVINLYQAGLRKVRAGILSLDEVTRVALD